MNHFCLNKKKKLIIIKQRIKERKSQKKQKHKVLQRDEQ